MSFFSDSSGGSRVSRSGASRRIRRRGVEFARNRGITISAVRLGVAGHAHPCRCGPCSICTCRTCISYLPSILAVREYQACTSESNPCGCRSYLGALVCPVCSSHGALCYDAGSLCCIRCASIFPRTDQRDCMLLSAQITGFSTLDNSEQTADSDPSTVLTQIESRSIFGDLPCPRPLTPRLIVTEAGEPSGSDGSQVGSLSAGQPRAFRSPSSVASRDWNRAPGSSPGSAMRLLPMREPTRGPPTDTVSGISLDLPSPYNSDDEFFPDCTGYGPRRLPQGVLGRGVKKNPIGVRRLHTVMRDHVSRRDNELEKCDDELLWYLRTQAALTVRDSDLPLKLKRKAEAWMRANRSGWNERDRHYAAARAVVNSMLDNQIDRGLRAMMRRQDPLQIEVFNRFMVGEVVPPRSCMNRFVYWLGFENTANRWWRATGYAVFPKTK